MNKEQRKELKRLAAEAFGWDWVCSPWRTEEGSRNADCGVYFLKREGHAYSICRAPRYSKESEWIPTGKFIAAANPQAITALLSALEAAEKALESNKAQWLSWEAKRASLEKDAARLDWIEKTSQRGHYCGVFRGNLLTRSSIDKEMA